MNVGPGGVLLYQKPWASHEQWRSLCCFEPDEAKVQVKSSFAEARKPCAEVHCDVKKPPTANDCIYASCSTKLGKYGLMHCLLYVFYGSCCDLA